MSSRKNPAIETCDGGCRPYPTLPRIRKQSVLGGRELSPLIILAQRRMSPAWSQTLDAKMAKKAERAKKVPPISKPAAGGLTGAVVGGLVGGPVGAVMGGLAGAVVGSAAEGKKPMKKAAQKLRSAGKQVGAKLSGKTSGAAAPRPAKKSSRKKAKLAAKADKSPAALGKKKSGGKTKSGKARGKK